MLRRKDDVGSSTADNIRAETVMSHGITRSAVAVKNADLGMTITIGMPKVQLGGSLESNMHTTVWSAL